MLSAVNPRVDVLTGWIDQIATSGI